MPLLAKRYKSEAGSTVKLYPNGLIGINFEWFDENACIDCVPYVSDDFTKLSWECDSCGGGSTELQEVTPSNASRYP